VKRLGELEQLQMTRRSQLAAAPTASEQPNSILAITAEQAVLPNRLVIQ
jgi:hypothetical protein